MRMHLLPMTAGVVSFLALARHTDVSAAEDAEGPSGPPQPLAGSIRAGNARGSAGAGGMSFVIYLPPGYDQGDKRYPVLFQLHGIGGDYRRFNNDLAVTHERAVAQGSCPPLIIVWPSGGKATMWSDAKDRHIESERRFFSVLLPHLDRDYRTLGTPAGRIICGNSMGGYGCLLYATKHPDRFGCAVSWAAALLDWPTLNKSKPSIAKEMFGDDEAYWQQYSPYAQLAKNAEAIRGALAIRMVIGAVDGLYPLNEKFRDQAKALGMDIDFAPVPGRGHGFIGLLEPEGANAFAFIGRRLKALQAW